MLLAWCSPRDLCTLAQTSRYFYVLSHQPELWRDACLLSASDGSAEDAILPQFSHTWKDTWRLLQYPKEVGASSPRQRPLSIPGIYSDYLYRQHSCRTFPIPSTWFNDRTGPSRCKPIDELCNESLSSEVFLRDYEGQNRPVVLKGAASAWPAVHNWRDETYIARSLGPNRTFRATSGTAQHAAQFTWSAYIEYCRATSSSSSGGAAVEEGPLYLFDRTAALDLAADWGGGPAAQPQQHDLFSLLGPDRRPDHTWLIAGSPRSGSVFHIDPNATHAWNACITGRKRWILSPPGQPPPGVGPSPDGDSVVLPISLGEWMTQYYYCDGQPLYECTVGPGDIMFVPHGWWHMVVNLPGEDVNIAVTHNYVAPSNLPNVLRFLREKREQVSGCRDRAAALQPDCLYKTFVDVLEKEEPMLLRTAVAEPDWTCKAWSSSVPTKAKKQKKDGSSVMEQAKTGSNGFSFSFLE